MANATMHMHIGNKVTLTMDFVLPADDENLTYRENFERREALINVTHGEMVTANKDLLEKFNYQHEYWITTKAFVLHKDIFKSKK